MIDNIISSIDLRRSFIETLEQFSEEGCLVDLFLRSDSTSEEIQDIVLNETQSIRIVLVGDDYVVLGPKRPLITCLVPLDSILIVRIADGKELEHEEEIDREIEENCFGWERDWPGSLQKTQITADGEVHFLDSKIFDQFVDDNDLIVVLYTDDSKNSMKVKEKMDRLAEEFKGQVIFVYTNDQELAEDLLMSEAPCVSIVHGEDILAEIEGVEGIRKYRAEIYEALEELEED